LFVQSTDQERLVSFLPSFPPAILALADGTVFRGYSIGFEGSVVGEVVFNTAMTGYQEILTDPSYTRQIVTLTHPHIGNTGCNDKDIESQGLFASGLIVRDLPIRAESWRMQCSLPDFLKEHAIVAIAGIDTRRLTRILREKGAQAGCIEAFDPAAEADAVAKAGAFPGLAGMDLAKEVSVDAPYEWNEAGWSLRGGFSAAGKSEFHVVVLDYGVKRNILRMLSSYKCRVTVVPAKTPASDVLAYRPDGVLLSNGPGDPEPCAYAIETIRGLLTQKTPIFGICLGHQLLALASGAKTRKMKFGHHGANHPVKDLDTQEVVITSQNHGFAVDAESLPPNLKATHVSLFDGTLQGVARTDAPAFSFQGHPEASPGPHDAAYLFERFITMMRAKRSGETPAER
jgi:carbamoyl-phosphate synthase small subunit